MSSCNRVLREKMWFVIRIGVFKKFTDDGGLVEGASLVLDGRDQTLGIEF
jgi:hypothetical protein